MAISEALKATPRVKSIQRTALAMLVVAGVINYVDRATLAVANPLSRDDLHLSIADMGFLLSAFFGAWARRRKFHPALASSGIGSLRATAALRPASSPAPHRSARRLPCRS